MESVAPDVSPRSRERAAAVSGALRAFLSGSEEVFLEAGAQVAALERRSRALIAGARGAVALCRDAGDPVAQLDGELARLDTHLRSAREASATAAVALPQLTGQLDAILGQRSTFEAIPLTLRMLGMNTRIENARSGAENAGMDSVAGEVRRLADQVEPQFRRVFDDAVGLLGVATGAGGAAAAFLARQGAWSAELLAELRGALEALRAVDAAAAALAQRGVTAAEQLSQDLSAVLVGLQGHDASRQVLEHALAALAAVEADAAADAADTGSWLADLSEVCALQRAQVQGARERLVGVLQAISAGLGDAAGRVAGLAEEAGGAAGRGSRSAPVERVVQGIARAVEILRAHSAQERESAAAMQRVAATVEAMTAHVRDIQGMGRKVKIIALNALVETERAGDGGRVLAVLAQAMGQLAGEVVRHTADVARSLEEIARGAAALGSGGEVHDGAGVAAALEELSARLGADQRRLAGGVESLSAESRALHAEVDGLVGRLAAAIAGADQLRAVEDALAALSAEAASVAGAGHASGRPGSYDRYTMDAERAVHDRALRRTPAAAPAAPLPAPDPTGLGANVELF